MPTHISVASAIEKNKVIGDAAWIILLRCDVRSESNGSVLESLYFCQNNENVTYHGDLYVAANFEFNQEAKQGEQPKIMISAHDETGVIREKLEEYNGLVGSEVTITVVNTDNLTAPPEIQETFKILSGSAQGFVSALSLGVENPLTLRNPTDRHFRDRCRFLREYKGPRCKYAGPLASCSGSLQAANGCKDHDNTINYGGYPGLRSTTRG